MTKIVERIALESVAKENGVRRVRLISPGQGSSGHYSKEVIAQYMAEALPKGSLVYLDHTSYRDEVERDGTRSIKDVAGKLVSDPVYEADAPEGEGSYVDVKFKRVVEEDLQDIADAIAVSIEVYAGRKDEYGNIVEMHHNPLNSLALVPVGGRDGKVFESFRAKASESLDTEGTDMPISKEEMEQIAVRSAALVVEALKPEPEEQKTETDVAALVEKVVAADLPAVLVKPVVEAVKAGTDVEDAIKAQKALVDSIREGYSKAEDDSDDGALSEGATKDKTDPTPADRGSAYMERLKKGNK